MAKTKVSKKKSSNVLFRKVGRPSKSSKSNNINTRDELIEAAKNLFAKQGYEGTTVKEICDLAGVNISLISYHFEGKEGLYQACVGDHGEERLEMAQRVLKEPKTKEELKLRLGIFIEEIFRGFDEEPELTLMALREAESASPVIDETFQATYLRFYEKLQEFLQKGQKNKLIKKDLDPVICASVCFGAITHFIRMDAVRKKFFDQAFSNDSEQQENAQKHLVQILLNGMC